MKKEHIKCKNKIFFLIIILLCVFIYVNSSNTTFIRYQIPKIKHMLSGQAMQINDYSLLELSALDTLELNITKLPIVTVNTDYTYVIEGEDGVNRGRPQLGSSDAVQQPIRSVTFTNLPYNQSVDIEVIAMFENCGKMDGKNIDMKIVYSDFYSASKYTGSSSYYQSRNNSKVLWWTAYGTIDEQTPENEWFQRGFQNINIKIYFYYHGESTPIHLDVAYFTLYSEDGSINSHSEAASSKTASQSYVYENTTMSYLSSLTLGNSTYYDVYYGTEDSDSNEPKKAAISYQYKNLDNIEIDMHILNSLWSSGYHVRFSALATTLPPAGVKEVNLEEIRKGNDLTYTINQQLPVSIDEKFLLNSMIFKDEINDNLVYKSLKVYDENNIDITTTAGTSSISNNTLMYTFNSDYLANILYTGQNYKFVIEVSVKDEPLTSLITNSAVIIFNNEIELTTNSTETSIISYIHIERIDEHGNQIVNTETLKGNIYEEYKTEAKEIEKYELKTIPDNANGTYGLEDKTITYIYRKAVKDIEVYKIWNDGDNPERPSSININLLSNNSDESLTVEITEKNEWYYKFSDLKKYNDETSEEIIYTIEETVPEGYYISNQTIDNNIIKITNTKYGKITINKFDNYSKKVLQDATFKIEKRNGDALEKIGEYTTNENGQAIISKLKQGSYVITEIHAPEGYKLNTETYEIEINQTQFEYEIDVPNKQQVSLPETGGNVLTFIIIGIILLIISYKIIKK